MSLSILLGASVADATLMIVVIASLMVFILCVATLIFLIIKIIRVSVDPEYARLQQKRAVRRGW